MTAGVGHPTINLKVCFSKPTIGPRDYISVGASGWAQVFSKKNANEALDKFVGPVKLDELLSNFSDLIRLKDFKCGWTDVTSYLARIFETKPDNVPTSAAIAFWCKYIEKAEATCNA